MREQWARRIAFFTWLVVLLLGIIFADIQNPRRASQATQGEEQVPTPESVEPILLHAERIEAGRQVYTQQGCARCHSIAGEGNPRSRLDGVGTRHSKDELKGWIIGADALQGVLPAYAFRLKQVYRKLPDDELDALVIYMHSLRPQTTQIEGG